MFLFSASIQWDNFHKKLEEFLEKTASHTDHNFDPGGYYKAIWPRDASYILKDQFLSTTKNDINKWMLEALVTIWSYQITGSAKEKLVFGRGSPEMKFKPIEANEKTLQSFAGALPTTIYRENGILEVYAQKPDIDSTALMISTTSWILCRLLLSNRISQRELSEAVSFLVPRMLRAVDYLKKCDIDNDGLLEQDHNEDWMDTILRRGKIVYSQASFILGLRDLSVLQLKLEHKKQARSIAGLAEKTIQAVDKKLWSDEDNAYIDIQDKEEHIGGPYRTLTQDVALLLIAITENLPDDSKIEENSQLYKRADSTLETMKKRIWKGKWPLVTKVELKKSGPWVLKPNQYHNHTFWPWTTGIEMLARFRFNKIEDCNTLFSKLASEDEPHVHTFYEWINPLTDKVQGAYPFRTGVSAVRIALYEILAKTNAAKMNAG